MASPGAVSCAFCYDVDEPASMIEVAIDSPALKHVIKHTICRFCGYAIARAVRATGELPPPREVIHE